MGIGISHVFAQHGFKVNLVDTLKTTLDRSIELITSNLERQKKKGLVDFKNSIDIVNNIHLYTNLSQGVSEVDIVIECVNESIDAKKKVFIEIEKASKSEAIIATNTSSLSITRLASITDRADKFIGMHFMNPPPLIGLVEIIKGYRTSSATVNIIKDLTRFISKTGIVVSDYPGFVANRILMPMINESIYTLYEGIADVESIDQIMILGMNHPMGPLKLADFIGLDVCLSILEVLYDSYRKDNYVPCPLLKKMVLAGYLGAKTGEGFYNWVERKPISVSKNIIS